MMNLHLAVADTAGGAEGEQDAERGPAEPRVPFETIRDAYGSLFRRAMRMSEASFTLLVDTLRPILPVGRVEAEARVSMSLRYFAGASYLDVCSIHGVSKTTFYDCLWDFVDAMLLAPELQMRMPLWNAAWRRETALGFQARGDNPLINIIGALDGIAIRQEMPAYTEVACPKDYWNRKGFFALNVQAVCDYNYEFLWMSCRTPGSNHDATALACSDLGQLLKNRTHPVILQLIAEGLCIAADDAYGDCELLATPWPGGGRGDEWRDAYNFYQSSARMHIEQAFGQLVGRWGIFWRPLRMPFSKRPLVIKVAFLLHNFCRRKDSQPALGATAPDGAADADRSIDQNRKSVPETPRQRAGTAGSVLRRQMTKRVENSGRRRPPVHRY